MYITKVSAITGKTNVKNIPVDPNDMEMWEQGYGPIDSIMPYLSNEDREFILSGVTTEEWIDAFKEDTDIINSYVT